MPREDLCRGPAQALRYGIDHAAADVVVVTMADGSDDPMQIDQLTRLPSSVVSSSHARLGTCAEDSRWVALAQGVSRLAGMSLSTWWWTGGTHDATNSFKAYSRSFVRRVGIDSDAGFELGIEMVAKARRLRTARRQAPTHLARHRQCRTSHFEVKAWIPRYLHWYLYALDSEQQVPRVPTAS